MSDWKAKLKALGPCPEAYRWAIKHKTLREAWRMCENFDWMRWLVEECGDLWELDAVDAVEETEGEPWEDFGADSMSETELQDAYIMLDFMPDPPRLPEIT